MVVRFLHAIGAALQRLPRAAAWTLVVAWFGFISWLSSMPGDREPASRLWAVFSNFAHAPLFGMLALWMTLLVPRRDRWPDLVRARVLAVLSGVAVCGILDELHQGFFTAGRDMSIFDLCTDVAGASSVLAVVRYVGRDANNEAGLALRVIACCAACITTATAATFVPHAFPEIAWL